MTSAEPEARLHVSFVCTGNICRSPYAEYRLRQAVGPHPWGPQVTVSSAGTAGIFDAPAHASIIECGADRGLDILGHRSRGVDAPYLATVDIVLGMAVDHVAWLREVYPEHAERVFLFSSFPEPHLEEPDIHDPMGFDLETFRAVASEIDSRIPRVVAELSRLVALVDPDRDSE